MADQWEGRFSRLIARLFGWYAPYFNAYTFVLARKNEYSADLASVEVAGRANAANALMRINVMARFQDEIFWPAIWRLVAAEPEPLASRTAFWTESVNNLLDEEARARLLDAGCREKTGYLDTHPSLGDRLAAMGAAADRDASAGLKLPAISAAASWLGESLPAIRDEFDASWREEIGETWRSKHAYLQGRRDRLAQLDEETPDPAEQWERLSIIAEVQPEADLVPLLDLFLKRFPDHLPARFRRGTLLLERGIEAGLGDVEAVMTADTDAVIPGCEAAWQFYREKDPEKAEGYRTRWEERSDYVHRVEAELQSLPADAVLAPAELDEETLANIRRILQRHRKQFRRVWVLRRILKTDRNVSDHLIAFETGRFFMVDNGPEVAKRLAAEEFSLRMFIVHLGSRPYKKFRRTISEMRVEPLDL